VNNDRTINLHTRSLKYGKLENGILASVHNKLVFKKKEKKNDNILKKLRRQKHHFVKLDCCVFLILAHNGNIWISEKENNQSKEKENNQNKELENLKTNEKEKISELLEIREKMAKVFIKKNMIGNVLFFFRFETLSSFSTLNLLKLPSI